PGRHGVAVRPGDRRHRLSPAGGTAVAIHGILGADHGPAVAVDRAVCARRHHGPAREDEPWLILWLIPCSALKTWCGGSAAFYPPTICRSTSHPASCTPSSAPTAPARPR